MRSEIPDIHIPSRGFDSLVLGFKKYKNVGGRKGARTTVCYKDTTLYRRFGRGWYSSGESNFLVSKENHGSKSAKNGDFAKLEEFTSCKQAKGEPFRT